MRMVETKVERNVSDRHPDTFPKMKEKSSPGSLSVRKPGNLATGAIADNTLQYKTLLGCHD